MEWEEDPEGTHKLQFKSLIRGKRNHKTQTSKLFAQGYANFSSSIYIRETLYVRVRKTSVYRGMLVGVDYVVPLGTSASFNVL